MYRDKLFEPGEFLEVFVVTPQAPELHRHAAVDDAAGMAEQVVQRLGAD